MDLESLYKRWVATGVGSQWAKAGRDFVDFTKTAPLTPEAMDAEVIKMISTDPLPPEPEPQPEKRTGWFRS